MRRKKIYLIRLSKLFPRDKLRVFLSIVMNKSIWHLNKIFNFTLSIYKTSINIFLILMTNRKNCKVNQTQPLIQYLLKELLMISVNKLQPDSFCHQISSFKNNCMKNHQYIVYIFKALNYLTKIMKSIIQLNKIINNYKNSPYHQKKFVLTKLNYLILRNNASVLIFWSLRMIPLVFKLCKDSLNLCNLS